MPQSSCEPTEPRVPGAAARAGAAPELETDGPPQPSEATGPKGKPEEESEQETR